MNIIIPDYAKGRIKRYNLTEDLIKDTLRNPDEMVKGYEGRLIAHKLLNEHVLRVVYLKVKDDLKVITVYPAKKERYFRKSK